MFDIVFYENPEKLNFTNVISVHPITASSGPELRKKIAASKEPIIVVIGSDDKINLEAVSTKSVDILLDPDIDRDKDSMHHKNSGFNIHMAQLANKNEIALGFSFERMFNKSTRAKSLARMSQNVILCRKYEVNTVLANFSYFEKKRRDIFPLKAFGSLIGLRTDEIKDSLSMLIRIQDDKLNRVSKAVRKV